MMAPGRAHAVIPGARTAEGRPVTVRLAMARLGAGPWGASAGVHGLVLAGAWLLLAGGQPARAPLPAYQPLAVEWLAAAPAPVAPEPGPAAEPALPRPEPLPQRHLRAAARDPAQPAAPAPVAPAVAPAVVARPVPDPDAVGGAGPVAAAADRAAPSTDTSGHLPTAVPPAARESVPAAPAPAARDDAYARWRQSFEQALQRDKRYPPSARRMGQSGTVWVQLTLAPDGGPQRIAVVGSSGFRSLDEAAEQLVRRVAGALQPSHPPGRPTELRIPIVYELTQS